MAVSGTTTFRADLLRSTTVDADAAFFSKDPFSINFGKGSATIAYRPIRVRGHVHADRARDGHELRRGHAHRGPGKTIEPLPAIPAPCADPTNPACAVAGFDGMPEVELFDLVAGDWVRLPHLAGGTRYAIAEPARYVDPTSGSVLIRFVNDRDDGVGFSFDLSMTGTVR